MSSASGPAGIRNPPVRGGVHSVTVGGV